MDDTWREREQQGEMVDEGVDENHGAFTRVRDRDGWTWKHYEGGLTRISHPVHFPGVERPPEPTVLERLGWPWWKRLWWEWTRK